MEFRANPGRNRHTFGRFRATRDRNRPNRFRAKLIEPDSKCPTVGTTLPISLDLAPAFAEFGPDSAETKPHSARVPPTARGVGSGTLARGLDRSSATSAELGPILENTGPHPQRWRKLRCGAVAHQRGVPSEVSHSVISRCRCLGASGAPERSCPSELCASRSRRRSPERCPWVRSMRRAGKRRCRARAHRPRRPRRPPASRVRGSN